MLLNSVCAIVDLETTGTNANSDAITEVGALLLDTDGAEHEFQQLLNPNRSIPPYIASLTGIDNQMVADKPDFSEIAAQLWPLINDTVFIAHNARFDYAFLKRGFSECGFAFRPKIVCTLKLARALYPTWKRYSLGAIIERIGHHASARHRAMADVIATKAFLDFAIDEHGLDAVNAVARRQLGEASIPCHLSKEDIQSLPDTPGVYYFYGEDQSLLYVGKSKTIRTRVKSHFGADVREPREMRMAQEIRGVEHQRSAGELGALLLENHDIKMLQPIYNRKQRPLKKLWCVTLSSDENGYLRAHIGHKSSDAIANTQPHGLFSSRSAATKGLQALADEHGLCKKMLGLEKGKGACFGFQLKRCQGACAGKQEVADHNEHITRALKKTRIEAWPFENDIGIVERCSEQGFCDVHLVSNWAYQGSWRLDNSEELDINQITETAQLLTKIELGFDKDTYRILQRYLQKPPPGALILTLRPATST